MDVTGPGPGATACPRCGEPTVATDSFCENCGNDLRGRRSAPPAAPANRTCAGCGDPVEPEAEYCAGCGLRRRDGTDHVEIHLAGLAGVTDRGKVHARNEDAMALGRRDTPAGVLIAVVVCDGVSSAPRPEQASRIAADTALERLLEADRLPPGGADTAPVAEVRVRDAVATAAAAVATLRAPGELDAPACTLVAALVEPDSGGDHPVITVGWVGDSRAYWLAPLGSPEPSRQLTSDHSWAAEMVAAGAISEAAALTGSAAHAITRWLGADGRPTPEVISFRPAAAGLLLLCSDGLWNYLPEPARLAAVARQLLDTDSDSDTDPETDRGLLAVAAELTTLALTAGGHDNITVALVPIAGRATDQYLTDPRRSP